MAHELQARIVLARLEFTAIQRATASLCFRAPQFDMSEVPTLIDLCLTSIANGLLIGDKSDELAPVIYDFPSELFHSLLRRLAPLALQRLQEHSPVGLQEDFHDANDNGRNNRKRRRSGPEILNRAWRVLYKVRWSYDLYQQHNVVSLWDEDWKLWGDLVDDWQQLYWQAHLQDCVDAVAETALIPSYNGSIGEIQIPDVILKHIGCMDHPHMPPCRFLKFSHHCQLFGVYARFLRLPNAICSAETCELLRNSMLERLDLPWIKSSDHVEGLCKLLKQNCRTLREINFYHCKLSPAFIDAICASLHEKRDLQAHGIQHFCMKRSSFLQTDSSPVPAGLSSLTSGKSLQTLTLLDDQLGPNFARTIFNSLLDASSNISFLDLSENFISGFLSQFRWRSSNGTGKSLPSLRVLNLRCCELVSDDLDCLRQALRQIPNLEKLDLSENSFEDGIGGLISYFREISERALPFSDLSLGCCDLTCEQAIDLLETLSTMKKPLNLLSIKGNKLCSEIGTPLGKFLCSGVRNLDIEDIGLGSSGFLKAAEEISNDSMVACVNISDNHGRIGAAKFMNALFLHANQIESIDASYNSMSEDSLPFIYNGYANSKGTLNHLNLTGNTFCDEIADESAVLAEFQNHRKRRPLKILLNAAQPNEPYDDDP